VPSTLLYHGNKRRRARGSATVLRITSVKLEGRKQITASEFANGARLETGERFGNT
jgi:hypothetical protein